MSTSDKDLSDFLGPCERDYFSVRTGRRPAPSGFTLLQFKRLFIDAYQRLERERIFREWLGHLDDEFGFFTAGSAGDDVPLYVFRRLRKDKLWPIDTNYARYAEDDLFDVVEFLHDHSSIERHIGAEDDEAIATYYDGAAGRARFREVMNDILADLGDGFEVSERGEILSLGDAGMRPLLRAPLPSGDSQSVEARVDEAKRKFLGRTSTGGERLDAVRGLADVLETLRPKTKAVLQSKNESDLFNLANAFGIRHHRADQKIAYDKAIWLSWMFHYYLGTIHALLRLIEKADATRLSKRVE